MASQQIQAPHTVAPATSGPMVTVGCKLPHGLHLDFNEPGKPIRRVTVKGTNSSRVVGGFGITERVPKDFFDEWLRNHRELPAVKNGLIFAMDKVASVEDKAADMASVRNYLEPLDPEKPGVGLEKLKTE